MRVLMHSSGAFDTGTPGRARSDGSAVRPRSLLRSLLYRMMFVLSSSHGNPGELSAPPRQPRGARGGYTAGGDPGEEWSLSGCPDIVLPKFRVAVFVNGCFWHQHPGCRKATLPKSNREFWAQKLRGNQERDAMARDTLSRAGWKTKILWECEIDDRSLGRLVRWIVRVSSPAITSFERED